MAKSQSGSGRDSDSDSQSQPGPGSLFFHPVPTLGVMMRRTTAFELERYRGSGLHSIDFSAVKSELF